MKTHECRATKVCNKCQVEKPIAEFYKNKHCADGYLNRCKTCNKEIRQNLKFNKPEIYARELQRAKDVKKCLGKAHLKQSKAKWHKKNKDSQNQGSKEYYQQNAEYLREWVKQYRIANPEKVKAANARWRDENREYHRVAKRARHAKRRAAKKNATANWADYKAISEFYIEAKRLSDKTGVEYHVDHIVPLLGETVCGLHVEDNLQVITAEENLRKNNRFC